MHDGLWSDTLDVLKWSVVADLCETHSLSRVLYVAMLTSRAGAAEGAKRYRPAFARLDVAAFFNDERERIARGEALRDARRVALLGMCLTPPLTIDVVSDPFISTGRGSYFGRVARLASEYEDAVLAFFDPDIGFARTKADARHVTVTEVKRVLAQLPLGSVVLVFQYRRQGETRKACEDRSRAALAEAASQSTDLVAIRYGNDVACVSTVRD